MDPVGVNGVLCLFLLQKVLESGEVWSKKLTLKSFFPTWVYYRIYISGQNNSFYLWFNIWGLSLSLKPSKISNFGSLLSTLSKLIMKKVIAVLTLVAMGVLAQSCGSSEKCPAYSYNQMDQAACNG